jgi:hypothetical protein
MLRSCRTSDEAPVQSSVLQVLGNPLRISSVALASGQGFDLSGIHQQQAKPFVFEYIPQRPPVNSRRFHGDFADLQLLQPYPHSDQIVAKGAVRLSNCLSIDAHRGQYANHNRVFVNVHAAGAAIICCLHLSVLFCRQTGTLKYKSVFP